MAVQLGLTLEAPWLEPATGPLTPITREGGVWVKRDDTFEYAGIRGGKVRTCLALAEVAKAIGAPGLVTAGSRSSPQVSIVARVAKAMGLACQVFVPWSEQPDTPEVADAKAHGAIVADVRPGHNSVIIAYARSYARSRQWYEVPFGMACWEAVRQTAGQVQQLPPLKRVVVPVGSGMSLAGVLWGLQQANPLLLTPGRVVGVVVGASPLRRLDKYAPAGWRAFTTLVPAGMPYHQPAANLNLGPLQLDPIYEAKCLPHLEQGDLLWVVGVRATLAAPQPTTWRISAKWANRRHLCNYEGITRPGGCGAECCKTASFWPPRANPDGSGVCARLGPDGCTFSDADKPVTCLLYPMLLRGGTIVGHLQMANQHRLCGNNHGHGPRLIEVMGPQFVALFGATAYAEALESVTAGKDYTFTPSAAVLAALQQEHQWAEAGTVPEARGGAALAAALEPSSPANGELAGLWEEEVPF